MASRAMRTRFGTGLLALFGGAALLLLLACVNIAGLLLARAAGREREMAVRAALGATRGRLMRHWLAESALLAAAGGLVGLLLAKVGLTLATGALPAMRDLGTWLVPVSLDVTLDGRAFVFTLAVCSAAALLAGLAPAWHAARANLNDSLKSSSPDPRRARLRTVLTVAQVAIGTLVLAVSSLLVVTLHRLANAPAGFDRDHVVTFTMDTEFARYTPEQNRALALRLEREARAIPGVAQAGMASRSLMRGSGFKTAVALPGTRSGHELNASTNKVSPAWFEAMGMTILAGRGLAESDGAAQQASARGGEPELRAPVFPGRQSSGAAVWNRPRPGGDGGLRDCRRGERFALPVFPRTLSADAVLLLLRNRDRRFRLSVGGAQRGAARKRHRAGGSADAQDRSATAIPGRHAPCGRTWTIRFGPNALWRRWAAGFRCWRR